MLPGKPNTCRLASLLKGHHHFADALFFIGIYGIYSRSLKKW